MNATTTSVSELASLKARLKATWMSGDFDKIAQIIAAGGAEFIAAEYPEVSATRTEPAKVRTHHQ